MLKGTWWAGTGENFDPDSTTPVPAGGFAIHAPREVHYDGAKDEEAIVQISGIGPSGTHVVNPGAGEKKQLGGWRVTRASHSTPAFHPLTLPLNRGRGKRAVIPAQAGIQGVSMADVSHRSLQPRFRSLRRQA